MDLTAINAAIDAAYQAALANPQKQAPQAVGGNANQTVSVVTYVAPAGPGFRVVGTLNVGGCRIVRVRNHGPDTASERAWPSDIESHVAEIVAQAKQAKARKLYLEGRAATLAIFSQLPLGVQAQFKPVLDASDEAAKIGDIAKAKLIVETCLVPEPLAATQAALVAALAPFVIRAANLAAATTVEEVEAV
jgi:hypothetical protein